MKIKSFAVIICFLILCLSKIDAQDLDLDLEAVDSLHTILKHSEPSNSIKEILLLGDFYFERRHMDLDSSRFYFDKAVFLSRKYAKEKLEIEASYSLAKLIAYEKKYEESLKILDTVLAKSKALNYEGGIQLAYQGFGYAHGVNGEDDIASQYFEKAYEISKKRGDVKNIVDNIIHVGLSNERAGNYGKALRFFNENSEILDSIDLSYKDEITYNSIIGRIRWEQEEFDKAYFYYKKNLGIATLNNDFKAQILYLFNVGLFFYQTKEYEKSIKYMNKSIAMEKEHPQAYSSLSTHQVLAYSYIGIGKKDKGIDFLEKVLEQSRKSGIIITEAHTLSDLGTQYIRRGDEALAKETFLKAIDLYYDYIPIAEKRKDRISLKDIYFSVYKADSILGNYKSSLANYQKHINYKDSILNEKGKVEVEKLEIAYETAKKEEEITRLKAANDIEKLKAKEERNYGIIITIGCGVLLLYLFTVLRSLRSRKKALIIIKEKYNENILLMREIHHRVKNNLQIILSLLNAQANSAQSDEKLRTALEESQTRIKSMAIIHQNLYNSNTYTKVQVNNYFGELLRQVQKTFSTRGKVIHFNTNVEDKEISMSLAVPLGLIINELVTNSYKYAFQTNDGSNNVSIDFKTTQKTNMYKLEISDNGIGLPKNFDITSLPSFGMQLVKGLVDQLNGTINIIDGVGANFEIYVQEPQVA